MNISSVTKAAEQIVSTGAKRTSRALSPYAKKYKPIIKEELISHSSWKMKKQLSSSEADRLVRTLHDGYDSVILENLMTTNNLDRKCPYTVRELCKLMKYQGATQKRFLQLNPIYMIFDPKTNQLRNLNYKEITEILKKHPNINGDIFEKITQLEIYDKTGKTRSLTFKEVKEILKFKNLDKNILSQLNTAVYDSKLQIERRLTLKELKELLKYSESIKAKGLGIIAMKDTLTGNPRIATFEELKNSILSQKHNIHPDFRITEDTIDKYAETFGDKLFTLQEMETISSNVSHRNPFLGITGNARQVSAVQKNNEQTTTALFSRNKKGDLRFLSEETVSSTPDKLKSRKRFSSGDTVVTESQMKDVGYGKKVIQTTRKTTYNSSGQPVNSEVIGHSATNPEYSTISTYDRRSGFTKNSSPISLTRYGSQGQGLKYAKNFKSARSIETSQQVISGPKGNGSTYIIKDKKGNIIYQQERRFRQIDENHFQSSINGQKYNMQYSDSGIKISKLDSNGKVIETVNLDTTQVDKDLIPLLKEMPGDMLIKLKTMGTKIKKIDSSLNAGFDDVQNYIITGKDPAVFMHELGHAIDYNLLKRLAKDKQFKAIYKRELAALEKQGSANELDSIAYFTKAQEYFPNSYFGEVVAEANSILSGKNITAECSIELGQRTTILQQHFPETIAYIGKKLQQV